ncbi:Threonine/homoserine exporter RhtA [Candidatus Arcanobacter lacustris]|jgi:drug/metabolite transporter (DMT)-like permease|uniref:S-adenosylmethionine uptake transporter n=1 Tax=Candidatus Arcanibacter lacustris TaxID=1607817 RepID=A0A0F5MPR9_9RICK|nr:Threonine/homoserine exporter RhtA [Candidatus Arcanobacter lacustris]
MSSYSNKFKGTFYGIISAFSFAASGTIAKKILQANFSVSNLLLWRYGIATIVVALVVYLKRDKLNFDKKALLKAFYSAAFFYSISTFCYFKSFEYIDTGLASAICFSHSLFVTLYVWIFDKQKLKPSYFIAFTSIVIGLIFLFQINEESRFNIQGILIALCSGLLYSFYIIANRNKASHLDPLLSSLMLFCGNVVIFLILSLREGAISYPTDLALWIKIIAMGSICTILPIYFLLKALRYINASDVTILSILRPVFVILLGMIFLNETLNNYKMIGITLILAGGLFSQLDKFKK